MVFDAKQKVLIVDIVQITHPKLVECPLGLNLFFFVPRTASDRRSKSKGAEPKSKTNESKPRKLPQREGNKSFKVPKLQKKNSFRPFFCKYAKKAKYRPKSPKMSGRWGNQFSSPRGVKFRPFLEFGRWHRHTCAKSNFQGGGSKFCSQGGGW